MEFLILVIVATFFYFILKPTKKVVVRTKSTKKKQIEILEGYKQKMDTELIGYSKDRTLFLEKKTALLKVFAEELSRNLFFDKDEARELIRELANYEISHGK